MANQRLQTTLHTAQSTTPTKFVQIAKQAIKYPKNNVHPLPLSIKKGSLGDPLVFSR